VLHPRLSLAACATSLALLSACTSTGGPLGAASDEPKDPAVLATNVADKAADVPVDTIVATKVEHGSITGARLTTADGKDTVEGRVSGAGWVASERLEPGSAYRLEVTAKGEDGSATTLTRAFTTMDLSLDQQTYPAVAPLKGETVGVGMPVIVTFDVPVKNRELFERNMAVKSTPAVEGSWTWLSSTEAHYRPKEFWPAGTKVEVVLRTNSLPAGDGVYGQQDQVVEFAVGRQAINVVDVEKHTLTHVVDGKKVRTIPVSTGDDSHRSREGTKVIMEKFDSVDMDAASTGVDSEDPGYYNISDVRWAMRVTNSGEFLHAAPWSVASQGRANVSHGCTGMSTADAAWLYERSRRGDVVEFVNSPRPLEDRNGWTDWNVPWSEWTEGSALTP
jgi:lipoprotein-anchoring transpeptidase ErfK/SrfK